MSVVTNIMSCMSTISMVSVKLALLQCLVKSMYIYTLTTQLCLVKIIGYMNQCMRFVTDELGCQGVWKIQSSCLGDFQLCCSDGIICLAALGILSLAPIPSAYGIPSFAAQEGLIGLVAQKRSFQLGCPEESYSAWLPRRGAFSLAAHIQAKLTEFRNTNIFCWWSVTAESDGYLRRHCVPSPSSRIFLIAM